METLLESLMSSVADEPLMPPDISIPPEEDNDMSDSDFWTKLLDIVSVKTHSYPVVESALKDYLLFATKHLSDFLVSDNDLFRAGYKLTMSPIFTLHKAFTRRKLIAMLTLAEEYTDLAAVVSLILLIDSDSHPATLEMMQEENACHALTRLLLTFQKTSALRLRRVLLELMFEMCKIQRISASDLENISDKFIDSLLRTVVNADRDDTSLYDASVMKVLLCLNEQYMIAAYDEDEETSIYSSKVLDLISLDIDGYVEFGAKLVLLLNRAIDTCLQIMGLKLLYLLFTNEPTYEYFYTNDLLVLIDVFIRELHDLPNDEEQLINTYLRVLHPLMVNSQIRHEPYKIDSLTDVLEMLSGHKGSSTFLPVSETTLRLAVRCLGVPWLEYTFPSPMSTVPPSPSSSIGSFYEEESPTRTRVPSIGITDFGGTSRRLSQSSLGTNSAVSSTTSLISSLKLVPPPPPSRASSKGPPVPPPSRGKSPMPIISRGKSPAPPPPPSRNSPAPQSKKERPRLPPSRKKVLDMSIRNTSVGDLSVAERE
ncbi:Protein LDB17 [Yarrowia sp. B02]|nr:Protein LDB17 [Yarrowia sp. B02]